MEHKSYMFKVLSPVERKNGKTFWMRIGNAFRNRDGSLNVYLNAYPTNGKLQIREFDDRDESRPAVDAAALPVAQPAGVSDQLPF